MPNFYKGPTGRFVSNHRDRVGVQFRRLYTTDMISSDEDRKMFGMCVDSFSFKHRINNHHLKRDDKKNPFTKGISLGKGTRHV